MLQDVRQYIVQNARESRGLSERCGSAVPRVDNLLLSANDAAGDVQPQHSRFRARLLLRRLLEAHIERWTVATWLHPLLEARAASAAATKISISASRGYRISGNSQHALWPCAFRAAPPPAARLVLVLDDAGDPFCNASSSPSHSSPSLTAESSRKSSTSRGIFVE